jgi:hypothetical protein
MGAGVEVTAPLAPKREGQIVAARFAANPQIGAGPPPFHPMGRDATAAGTKLCKEVRQLMAKSSVNLSLAVSGETAVEQNACGTAFCVARGGPKRRSRAAASSAGSRPGGFSTTEGASENSS